MEKQYPLEAVSTPLAPGAIGPYSQGVLAGNLLFISGQLPVDPKTGDFVQGGIEEKTHRVLMNVKAIVDAAGADLSCVAKTTIFLTDMSHFSTVNKVYAQYFSNVFPARSTVQVAALPKGAEIEVEAVVYLPH
jgi:2-iminobutanoate/2-iminopropanoate deaminase